MNECNNAVEEDSSRAGDGSTGDVRAASPDGGTGQAILVDCGSDASASIQWCLESRGITVERIGLHRGNGKEAFLAIRGSAARAIVISGSVDHLWQEGARCLPPGFLEFLVGRELPVLGICYGHQMLGALSGVRVVLNVRGEESGDVELEVAGEPGSFPLFDGLGSRFKAYMKHHDMLAEVPAGWKNHARTELTDIVAIQHPSSPVFGLQFHPEMCRAKVRDAVFDNFVALFMHGNGG